MKFRVRADFRVHGKEVAPREILRSASCINDEWEPSRIRCCLYITPLRYAAIIGFSARRPMREPIDLQRDKYTGIFIIEYRQLTARKVFGRPARSDEFFFFSLQRHPPSLALSVLVRGTFLRGTNIVTHPYMYVGMYVCVPTRISIRNASASARQLAVNLPNNTNGYFVYIPCLG